MQGTLKNSGNRRLLSAVRAAARMRVTGPQWLMLLTARREDFGSPRSQRARALCEVLEQVVAEHAAPAVEQCAAARAEETAAG
ncbi:hypothetical protein [Streptomyces yaizuensis]|uniref:Uncharacterized protein n=1 Tax=Streptomyces yaizuensis TaxID=2989713 RepID=A0ABQ5P5Z2_9ACTN|nr:hypothetical protein [Streptomyces sp. YSPA8]GLF98026.1 hypothetical protein SYYSPA8_27035 [Streptomyces sp. YSPA8]